MDTSSENGNGTEWLLKAEAVALLGTSARQLERRAEAGNIGKRVEEKQPWQRAAPVYYSKADILALKAGKPNQHAVLVNESGNGHPSASNELPTPATTVTTRATTNPGTNPENVFQILNSWKDLAFQLSALAGATPATTQPTSKPWMTLKEASAWSGMPVRWIRARAEAGWEGAEDIGTGKAKFWRINRDALARTMR